MMEISDHSLSSVLHSSSEVELVLQARNRASILALLSEPRQEEGEVVGMANLGDQGSMAVRNTLPFVPLSYHVRLAPALSQLIVSNA